MLKTSNLYLIQEKLLSKLFILAKYIIKMVLILHLTLNSFTLSTKVYWSHTICTDFHGGSDGKASVYNVGDPGLISRLGRSPGEGNGNPLQYSCLENPMDGGTW